MKPETKVEKSVYNGEKKIFSNNMQVYIKYNPCDISAHIYHLAVQNFFEVGKLFCGVYFLV